MTTNVNGNDRVRKTLASQLDRLDQILDGLSDGLNEAVSEAVKGAVGVAVKEALQAVLTEVLTSPSLLEQFQPPAPPTPESRAPEQPADPCQPSSGSRPASLRGRLRSAGEATSQGVKQAVTWAGRQARRHLTGVLLAGAGVAAAVAGFLFRPRLTMLAGWIASGVSALATRLGLRRPAAPALVT